MDPLFGGFKSEGLSSYMMLRYFGYWLVDNDNKTKIDSVKNIDTG